MKKITKKIDCTGFFYTAIWMIGVYLIKIFFVKQNSTLIILSYVGIVFLALGFILSILEKLFALPFFISIPYWHGAGILVNACSIVGAGLAFTFRTFNSLLLGGLIALFILVIQRSIMNKT